MGVLRPRWPNTSRAVSRERCSGSQPTGRLQDNDRNILNQLGGTPQAVAAGRVKIACEHGAYVAEGEHRIR